MGWYLLQRDLFIFWFFYNLFHIQSFMKVFYWILESYIYFPIKHYLDNFIATILVIQATPNTLAQFDSNYKAETDILGIFCRKSKNKTGIVILIFDIEINTNLFMTSLPVDKLYKALAITASTLFKNSFMLKETQFFIIYLSFCAIVAKLGWVFIRSLRVYIAQFIFLGQ